VVAAVIDVLLPIVPSASAPPRARSGSGWAPVRKLFAPRSATSIAVGARWCCGRGNRAIPLKRYTADSTRAMNSVADAVTNG